MRMVGGMLSSVGYWVTNAWSSLYQRFELVACHYGLYILVEVGFGITSKVLKSSFIHQRAGQYSYYLYRYDQQVLHYKILGVGGPACSGCRDNNGLIYQLRTNC
jgi:hypothetical protein